MAPGKKKRSKGRKGQKPKKGGAGKRASRPSKKAPEVQTPETLTVETLAQAQAQAPTPLAAPAAAAMAAGGVVHPEPPTVMPPTPPAKAERPLAPAGPLPAPVAVRRTLAPTWYVFAALALLAAFTYAVPGLARFRPWRSGDFEGALRPEVKVLAWRGEGDALEAPALRPLAVDGVDLEGALRLALSPSADGPLAPGEVPYRQARPGVLSAIFGTADVEDPSDDMAHFYESLARTKALAPGGPTRVVHLGDSPIVGDLISGGMRERLQRIYGDAGHGWTLPARAWDWYYHYGVTLDARGWRACSPLFGNGGTNRCGLNGVSFRSASPSAWSRITSASKGFGSAVSHVWVYYGVSPGGGTLEASVDGGDPRPIPTSGPAPAAAGQDLSVSEGRHTITLRPRGDGEVALYGVALEREVPGVIYDSVGTSGGTARFLTLLDERDWEESLRLRRPDLVILNFGTNESTYEGLGMGTYSGYLRTAIARVRRAVPSASVLIMAPMDRGTRDASGRIVTLASIPKIVAAQRAVAQETGCAFFDTYQAMGGEGTMARWHQREDPLVTGDLTHPTNAGADVVSKLLVDALQKGFDQHASGQTQR